MTLCWCDYWPMLFPNFSLQLQMQMQMQKGELA